MEPLAFEPNEGDYMPIFYHILSHDASSATTEASSINYEIVPFNLYFSHSTVYEV